MKNQIVIIGTNPPCARCRLLTKVLSSKVEELQINAEVRHISYTDTEAVNFAKGLGLETGTASIVARRLQVEIDNSKLQNINYDSVYNSEYDDYNFSNWSYELDEHLRPFQNRANEVGILMTPAVIINNELKHQGSVPRIDILVSWLLELKK